MSDGRIITTHAGSLPRPEGLTALLTQQFRGRDPDQAMVESQVEAAVEDVVARQLEAGLDIVGDGEQGRESFFSYVQHRMSGFGGKSNRHPMADMHEYPGYSQRMVAKSHPGPAVNLMTAPRIVGEVSYIDSAAIDTELARFTRVLARHGKTPADAFVTAASPGIIAAAMDNDFYGSRKEALQAVGRALAVEYRAVLDAGFSLQIDAPDLAMERHCCFAYAPLDTYLEFVDDVVGEINSALASLPTERVRLHVCWGNYEGPHDKDVPLESIWAGITSANVGALLLSMANPRHAHEYRLLSELDLPQHVRLIAGVIDTTTNYIEHPDVVADRLERIARVLGGTERLLAGTDCGFETAAGFQSVHADIAWAKLRSLCVGAERASERLNGRG